MAHLITLRVGEAPSLIPILLSRIGEWLTDVLNMSEAPSSSVSQRLLSGPLHSLIKKGEVPFNNLFKDW